MLGGYAIDVLQLVSVLHRLAALHQLKAHHAHAHTPTCNCCSCSHSNKAHRLSVSHKASTASQSTVCCTDDAHEQPLLYLEPGYGRNH